jgi:hypothetical protein
MSADDKLNLLKEMITLVGEAILQGEQRLQFEVLSARYEELSHKLGSTKRAAATAQKTEPLPDIYTEYKSRERDEFMRWIAMFEIPILKQIVKKEQFDPAKRAARWRKAEKFGELIYEQLEVRAHRGEGFGRVAINRPR